jgi:hypothetical protein
MDVGRVTLAGRAFGPEGSDEDAARAAHVAAVPQAAQLAGFGDFSLWVLRVDRVRWVGGYGRMQSAEADAYAAAEPDPVEPVAIRARDHLNDDHADALLAMARALAGYTDATGARCEGLDRYGLDLEVQTPRGEAPARVGFGAPVARAEDLRGATVTLARRARRP